MSERGKFAKSMGHALNGIAYAVRTQRNMRIHLAAAFAVIILGLALSLPVRDMLLLILAIFLVWIAEMINTAVECVVNLITGEHRKWAGLAKDVAAGAVLLAAILSVVIGFVVLGPPLMEKLGW